MQKDGEVRCVPHGDLILGEKSPEMNCIKLIVKITLSLSVFTVIIVVCYTSSVIVRIIQIEEGWTF